MKRSQLIRTVATQLHKPPEDIGIVLDAIIDVIGDSLAHGETVMVEKFGRFEPRLQREVIRQNPHTREDLLIPEKRSPRFVASRYLKARINR